MADIKLKKYGPIVASDISAEEQAAALKALEEYFVGASQNAIGQGRRQLVDKFLEFLNSLGAPDRMQKLETEIKELQTMQSPQRFRTQFFLLMIDVFQTGMYFALNKQAAENEWNLIKVLGLEHLDPNKPAPSFEARKK